MSDGLEPLLNLLADGQRHTGVRLADTLGLTRAAVWKRIEGLRELGLGVEADARGYRLSRPFHALQADRIRARLDDPGLPLEVRFLVDSSNSELARTRQADAPAQALLAEAQSAGRGRRGRRWRSPPGSGIYLSLAWRFESGLTGLAALSLVAGLAAAETLRAHGAATVGLKWPNDLWADDHKLGGCLIDINGTAEGPCEAIIGLGLNVDLPQANGIDQAWTDLARLGVQADRNQLAADLINRLSAHARRLDHQGFAGFLADWPDYDLLAGRTITVQPARGPALAGTAGGIDPQGRLALDHPAGRQWISQGEVSVRPR
jgi:BirA family transcriptional regulator, biotin operon repressor / biotin---[acetyl-CoA-carboxylase] ligase